MRSDEELMLAYIQGEQAAFQEIFERYAPLLLRLMMRGMSHAQDAQDLVQRTFLQLHRARYDFRADAALRPWLLTIALNLKREHLRTLKRSKQQRQRLYQHLKTQPQADAAVAGDGLEEAQRVQQLHLLLAQLPSAQREVIELHWFEGLSFAEVAALVGASLSAVKVRAHRGYKQLKQLFQQSELA